MDLQDIAYIARALGKSQKTQNGYVCRCPVHDDREPSLSLVIGNNGDLVVNCFANCDFKAIFDALRSRKLLPAGNLRVTPRASTEIKPNPAPKEEDPSKLRWIQSLWAAGEAPHNSPAEIYLDSRYLFGTIPSCICYLHRHKHLDHDTGAKTWWPCLMAAIQRYPSDEICALQLIYLTEDGQKEAPVNPNKRIIGSYKGAAIRIGELGEEIQIAEGLVTALSVHAMTSKPVLAALSANNLHSVVLPETVKVVRIKADNDATGLAAAKKAAQRYAALGKKVTIETPVTQGFDHNDLLKEIHKQNKGGLSL